MFWGVGIWGTVPWGVAGLTVAGSGETAQALANSRAQVCHLVEIEVGTGAAVAVETLGWPALWGVSPWGTGAVLGTPAAGTATLRFSDIGWVRPFDDELPFDVTYPPRLAVPARFERSFAVRPWTAGAAPASYGYLELANADGRLDGLAGTPAEGRRVTLMTGRARPVASDARFTASQDLTRVFTVRAGSWTVGRSSVRLELTSRAPSLAGPANPTRYAGTGGAEGGAELAGLPKPLTYGQVFNARAVLVTPANNEYQTHDGAVRAYDAVRVQGVAQIFDADYADRASLLAAQPGLSVGEYATCLAEGRFVLATTPSGEVTFDGRGETQVGGTATGYVSSVPTILGRFLAGRQGVTDYSASGFAQLNPGTAGVYLGAEDRTALQLVAELIAGVGGVPGETAEGLLTAYTLKDPAAQPVAFRVLARDVLAVRALPLPAPPATVEVSYRRNFTPQPSGLAGSVSTADREDYARPFRVVRAASGAGALNAAALEIARLDSPLADSGDAQTVANAQAALHTNARRLWQVSLGRGALGIGLGDTLELTAERVGTQKRVQVVGLGLALDRGTVDLTVWG
jgi:hypothetical protein